MIKKNEVRSFQTTCNPNKVPFGWVFRRCKTSWFFLVNGEANKLPIFVWRIENWDKDWFYYIRLQLQILGEFFLAII